MPVSTAFERLRSAISPNSSLVPASAAVDNIKRTSLSPPVITNPPRPAKSRLSSFSASIFGAGWANQLLIEIAQMLQRQSALFGEDVALTDQLDGRNDVVVYGELHDVRHAWAL